MVKSDVGAYVEGSVNIFHLVPRVKREEREGTGNKDEILSSSAMGPCIY